MENYKTNIVNESIKKWILWGILFISLFSSLMHFVYDLSGESVIVGLIAPINESVWEHLKLAFLPTIIWWIISYIVLSKKENISLPKWFVAMTVAVLVTPIFVVTTHYTITKGLGIESLFLDIASLFVGIAIAQILGLHIYKYLDVKNYHVYIFAILLVLLFAAFIIFTFNPPHLPMFLDSPTNTYGIYKISH